MFRVHLGRDAVAQVEDVARVVTEVVENAFHLGADRRRRRVQHRRVQVALQRHPVAHPATGFADIDGPVQAQGVTAAVRHGFQPQPAVLGEQDHRHLAALVVADQTIDDALHVAQGKLRVGLRRQGAAPGVEDLHRLGAVADLGVQVVGDRAGQLVEQGMGQLRAAVDHALEVAEVLAGAAFHHIGGERPGAAGETDQRHPAVQLPADGAHRAHHIVQITLRVRHRQRRDVLFGAHGLAEFRPLAGLEIQPQAHGVGDGEDVREQNRRVQRVTLQGLQGDLAGQFRVTAQVHEGTGFLAGGAVFGQVAAGLTHHPYRGAIHRLTGQGFQEAVVLQCSIGHR